MGVLKKIKNDLRLSASDHKAKILQTFFKTRKGEYGYGDKFLGVVVPSQRIIAKKYFRDVDLKDLASLLKSKFHEERLTALLILILQYNHSTCQQTKKSIYDFYLRNTAQINNWDLVDLSAPKIVGNHLLDQDKRVLTCLAKDGNLWKRRIAIVATWHFIRNNFFSTTLKLTKILLNDREDLIHKACGWMLREVGKKNQVVLERFLSDNYCSMPRTMLRYAIERLPPKTRLAYLKGLI